MEVGSVYFSSYGAKGNEHVRKEDKRVDDEFVGKILEKETISPKDMTLEEYKSYFNEKMDNLYTHPSQRGLNDVIDITDAAYKRMQTDPEYEQKILDALAKNKAVNFGRHIPVVAYTHVDDTWEKCYGYTKGMKENDSFTWGTATKRVHKTEKTTRNRESSEAEEMAAFKKEFYAELEMIPKNGSIVNLAINISEEAFENMKADPKYRAKILSVLRRDLTSSFAPTKASLLITVGATEEDYRGDSWSGPNNDSEFYARSQDSFYKSTSEKKDRKKELLEQYLEKRARTKRQQQELFHEKITKQQQERVEFTKAWRNERQLAKASSIYEANVMTEPTTSEKSLFG